MENPTEDDTFLKLKRTPLEQLEELYFKWISTRTFTHQIQQGIDDFFKSHGWTIEEYSKQVYNGGKWARVGYCRYQLDNWPPIYIKHKTL